MTRFRILFVFVLVLGLGSFGFAKQDPVGIVTTAEVSFGFDVFKSMMKHTSQETVLFSPASLQDGLGAIHLGARVESYEALDSLMRFEAIAPDQFYLGMTGLHNALRGSDARLSSGATVYIQSGISVRPEWATNAKGYYGAQVHNVDLRSARGIRAVAPWGEDLVGDSLGELLLSKPKMVVVDNTSYHGVWAFSFERDENARRSFRSRGGGEVPVSMMQKTDRFGYLKGNGFQAVCLPFAGHRMAMYVFLPDSSLSTVLGRLNSYSWVRWMMLFKPRVGTVSFPKLHVRSAQLLDGPLRQLGLGVAYTNRANFGGIGENLSLTSVVDFSRLDLDEASNASSTRIDEVETTPAISAPPFLMVMSRPFFFVIRDTLTGGIMLMGVIGKPSN